MRATTLSGVAAFCLASAACTQLPVRGPDYHNIVQDAATATVNPPNSVAYEYALVDINQFVVSHAFDVEPGSFYKTFGGGKGPAPEVTVGRGDVVQLTIFESKSGGLFVPADFGTRPGNYVTLPPQIVDHDGIISVPYAGTIHAAGQSLPAIEREIEERLADRAIEPKVIAALNEQRAGTVAVLGEVTAPRKVAIAQNGERILDMIALAGGIRYPGYETFVTVQRGGRKSTVYFNTLVTHPEENIYVLPGDTLYVYREPRRFLAFGALGVSAGAFYANSNLGGVTGQVSGQFNFDQEHVSLAEGVAKAGGLLDERANAGQVFLYRPEPREFLQKIGVDVSRFPPRQELIPTIYRTNFRDPSSYFYAQQFPLRNKDIIYAANAEAIEVLKFLVYTRAITGTVAGVADDAAITRQGVRYTVTGKAPGL